MFWRLSHGQTNTSQLSPQILLLDGPLTHLQEILRRFEPFAFEFSLTALKATRNKLLLTGGTTEMTHYLFIESRDPFESQDTRFVEETATALKQRGHEVTVFLVQNGVLASRKNAGDDSLARMVAAGVSLLADDFSLCERGIEPTEVRPGIERSGIEQLVEALVQENTSAIWH
jgi:hypothetical protein